MVLLMIGGWLMCRGRDPAQFTLERRGDSDVPHFEDLSTGQRLAFR